MSPPRSSPDRGGTPRTSSGRTGTPRSASGRPGTPRASPGRAGVLQAAIDVMADAGGANFSLGAVAGRAGVSKPAVLHHYASMDELSAAVAERMVTEWGDAMLAHLGASLEDSTLEERMEAFVVTAVSGELRDSYLTIYANVVHRPVIHRTWRERFGAWFAMPGDIDPARRRRLLLARYAAAGLWMEDATDVASPKDDEERAALREMILALLADPDA